jgi:uncharacterized protein YbjT (DUF2867 family)
MRVFVTGGKGDLGRRVVPRLLMSGHEVVVGTRSPQPRSDGATEHRYQLSEPTELPERTAAVVHLATDPFRSKRDLIGIKHLVVAAATAGVGHLVYVSIVGIDDHPYPYYRRKLGCELIVERSGVPWTILRATQFHSLTRIFAEQFRLPFVLFPSGIPFQPVDADEVADRVAEIAVQSAKGRASDLGGPEVLDFKESIQAFLRATGSRKPVWSMPVFGKTIKAFRSGRLLTPNESGGRTFDQWLLSVSGRN